MMNSGLGAGSAYLEFMSKRVKRSSIEVKPISISEEELKEYEALLASRTASDYKNWRLKKSFGGLCIICKALPRYIVSYNANHCSVIQRYCENCAKKENFI